MVTWDKLAKTCNWGCFSLHSLFRIIISCSTVSSTNSILSYYLFHYFCKFSRLSCLMVTPSATLFIHNTLSLQTLLTFSMVFILNLICVFHRIVGTSELPMGEVPSIGETPRDVRQYYEKRYVNAKNQKLDPYENLQLMLSTETDNC